jgi:AcrR family transcriptional regulator
MTKAPTRPRGRPRLFDEEAVLDELTALFWRQGYAQTSMSDLVEASGVHKSSLYSTFGTKDELFATILRRYFDARMGIMSALIDQAGPGIEGIHAFLELVRADVVWGSGQEGCLLVNSSSELHGSAPGYEDFGRAYRDGIRELVRVLIAGADAGTAGAVIDQRTELFVNFLFGLIITVRGGAEEAEIGRVVDAMHATVDTWRD